MLLTLKKLLTHNALLKVVSCILACSIWYIISHNQKITLRFNLPVCFDCGNDPRYVIQAPERLMVDIAGKRSDLADLDLKNLAVHIPVHTIQPGIYPLIVTEATLLLPASCNVVHYCPTNPTISIVEKMSSSPATTT